MADSTINLEPVKEVDPYAGQTGQIDPFATDSPPSKLPSKNIKRQTGTAMYGTNRTGDKEAQKVQAAIAGGKDTENALRQADANLEVVERQKTREEYLQDLANLKGEPLSVDDLKLIEEIGKMEADPEYESVWERGFAEKLLMDSLGVDLGQGTPDEIEQKMAQADSSGYRIAGLKLIERKLEEVNAEYNETTGGLGKTWDFLDNMFASAFNYGEMDGQMASLVGSSRKRLFQEFWSLTNEEQAKWLDTRLERMYRENPQMALEFLQILRSHPTAAQTGFDNIMSVVDVSDVVLIPVGIGKSILKGGARAATRRAASQGRSPEDLARIAQAQEEAIARGASLSELADIAGNPAASVAARTQIYSEALENIISVGPSQVDIDDVRKLTEEGVSFKDLEVTRRGQQEPKKYRAVYQYLKDNAVAVRDWLTSPDNIRYMSAEEFQVAVYKTAKQLAGDIKIPILNNFGDMNRQVADIMIKDVSVKDVEDVVGKDVPMVEMHVHKADGMPFDFKETAKAYAEHRYMKPSGYHQYADGTWSIVYRKPVAFDRPKIETGMELPDNWRSRLAAGLLSATELLSAFENANRGIALHKQQAGAKIISGLADNLTALSPKQKDKLAKVLEFTRSLETVIADDNGEIIETIVGRWFHDSHELEEAYLQVHNRLPDEKEIKAYWSVVRMADIDYTIRNLEVYRDKATRGFETFILPTRKLDPETGELLTEKTKGRNRGKPFEARVEAREFLDDEGKPASALPKRSSLAKRDFNVAVVNPQNQHWTIVNRDKIDGNFEEYVKRLVDAGTHKILQVYAPNTSPMKNALQNDTPAHFIVTPVMRKEPLKVQQFEYHGSMHQVNMNDQHLKQAKFATNGVDIVGDVTLLGVDVPEQGRKLVKLLEPIREMIHDIFEPPRWVVRDGVDVVDGRLPRRPISDAFADERWDDVAELARRSGLPWDIHSLKKMFSPESGHWSYNTPIRMVSKGKSITHDDEFRTIMNERGWRDERNSEFNPSAATSNKFTGERNELVSRLTEEADEQGMLKFQETPVLTLDPLRSVTRGVGDLIRDRSIGRSKEATARHFVEMVAAVTKDTEFDTEVFRNNPLAALQNFDVERDLRHLSPEKRQQFKNLQRATLEFIGEPSKASEWFDLLKTKLADSIYKKYGVDMATRFTHSELAQMKDPSKFFRAMAFHLKLGFFNPVQFFVQAQSLTHVLAFAPGEAIPAMMGAVSQQFWRVNNNDQILDYTGKLSKKFGWQEGWMKESNQVMQEVGYKLVEGDVAYLDDAADPTIFRSKTKKFLDKGALFFNTSERLIRMSAWNAAYLQWKKANPNKALRAVDKREILINAKDLAVNMTRESNASWQRGLASVPTQFFTYQARLMDAFLGKRFTTKEKMRAFAVYSAMYGIPGGMGAAFGIYPWAEDIKFYAEKHQIAQGDGMGDAVARFAMNGMIDTVGDFLAHSAGLEGFAWSDRVAPNGIPAVRDLFWDPEFTFFDAVGGASYSIGSDIIKDTFPLRHAIWGWMSNSPDKYPVRGQDLLNVTNNISTLSSATRVAMAFQYGKFITTNGHELGDMTTLEATIQGVFGVQPERFDKMYRQLEVVQSIEDSQQELSTYIRASARNYWQAIIDGDENAALDFATQLKSLVVLGGFSPDQHKQLMDQVLEGMTLEMKDSVAESLMDKQLWTEGPLSVEKRMKDRAGEQ